MATYSVYLPPEAGNDASVSDLPDEIAERIVFLADNRALLALIAPAIWLIWQRLWLGLAFYVLAVVATGTLVEFGNPELATFLSVLPGFFLFLEGHEMIRRRYERQGWHFDGVVEAGDAKIAELQYFSRQNYTPAPGKPHQPATPLFARPTIKQVAPFGLFPE